MWKTLILIFLVGCSSTPITHFQGVAHTHRYHIQIAAALSLQAKEEIKALVDETFEEIDFYYNHWNPHSELSRVNQGAPASPKIREILSLALGFKKMTGGRYDPFLGAIISAWKKSLSSGEMPELESAQATINLDGMLKGYTIDLLLKKLSDKGYKDVYVEWGGDIGVQGRHPEKRAWRVSLEGEVLEIEGGIATSGNEEQNWRVNGQTFTHIIDPFSLKALEVKEFRSVTVKAPTCAEADALATACMTFTQADAALTWAHEIKKKHKGVEFWIVTKP